jgi:hypothetical protein
MSQQAVSFVIHALSINSDLRDRFAISPIEVLVDLRFVADIDLTLDEIEVLVRSSRELWDSTGYVTHAQIH